MDEGRGQAVLKRACRALVKDLCKRGSYTAPAQPLKPGAAAPAISVERARAAELSVLAAREAARGAVPPQSAYDALTDGERELPRSVVWRSGADELLVLLDTLSLRTDVGLLTVAVEVACDELDRGSPAGVEVDLVVGTPERPAGLLAAATPPRGPALAVERWGGALVALAWRTQLDCAAGLAQSAGRDLDGNGLLPTSWSARRDGIAIGAQARHEIDRRRPEAVLL